MKVLNICGDTKLGELDNFTINDIETLDDGGDA